VAGTTIPAVVAVIGADTAEDPAVAIAVDSAGAAEVLAGTSVDTAAVIGDTISGTCLK
jgi:hypothetical protein